MAPALASRERSMATFPDWNSDPQQGKVAWLRASCAEHEKDASELYFVNKQAAIRILLRYGIFRRMILTSWHPLYVLRTPCRAARRPGGGACVRRMGRGTIWPSSWRWWCARLLDMLILVCEMLDARAAADVRLVSGQQGNRTSLDASGKSPSCGLALVPTAWRVRVRQVVDNPAKLGHDGIKTLVTPGSYAIVVARPGSLGPGPLRASPTRFWDPPSRKAVFPNAPTHKHFITIS